MEIPEVPKVPADIDEEARNFLESLEDKIGHIDAAIFKGDCLHILSSTPSNNPTPNSPTPKHFEIVYQKGEGEVRSSYFTDPGTFGAFLTSFFTAGFYQLSPNMFTRRRRKKQHDEKVEQFKEANKREAEEKTKDINIYQLTNLGDVEKATGKEVEIVDVGPENFLTAKSTLALRAKAHLLGANAIFCYQIFDGLISGTPLRYK